MKKKLNLILWSGAMLSLILTGCVTTQVANLRPINEEDVEVFTTTEPVEKYRELKYVRAEGSIFHNPEKLLQKLRQRAEAEGADAVINVQYGYQFWWPYVEGTAIKFSGNE